jgi:hypothetical protein
LPAGGLPTIAGAVPDVLGGCSPAPKHHLAIPAHPGPQLARGAPQAVRGTADLTEPARAAGTAGAAILISRRHCARRDGRSQDMSLFPPACSLPASTRVSILPARASHSVSVGNRKCRQTRRCRPAPGVWSLFRHQPSRSQHLVHMPKPFILSRVDSLFPAPTLDQRRASRSSTSPSNAAITGILLSLPWARSGQSQSPFTTGRGGAVQARRPWGAGPRGQNKSTPVASLTRPRGKRQRLATAPGCRATHA